MQVTTGRGSVGAGIRATDTVEEVCYSDIWELYIFTSVRGNVRVESLLVGNWRITMIYGPTGPKETSTTTRETLVGKLISDAKVHRFLTRPHGLQHPQKVRRISMQRNCKQSYKWKQGSSTPPGLDWIVVQQLVSIVVPLLVINIEQVVCKLIELQSTE